MTNFENDQTEMFAIVELFGHVRRAGRVTKADFPADFVRLDIPDGQGWITQIINPSAVYAITPTTEEIARRTAGRWRPEPVRPWELEPAADKPEVDDDSAGGPYDDEGFSFR